MLRLSHSTGRWPSEQVRRRERRLADVEPRRRLLRDRRDPLAQTSDRLVQAQREPRWIEAGRVAVRPDPWTSSRVASSMASHRSHGEPLRAFEVAVNRRLHQCPWRPSGHRRKHGNPAARAWQGTGSWGRGLPSVPTYPQGCARWHRFRPGSLDSGRRSVHRHRCRGRRRSRSPEETGAPGAIRYRPPARRESQEGWAATRFPSTSWYRLDGRPARVRAL